MGLYTGITLDGQRLEDPVINGGTWTNGTMESDNFMFDGLTGFFAGFAKHTVTVTVANGATTGDEASITMPANFTPLCMATYVTVAATNATAVVDVGPVADPDGYVDGVASGPSLATTGFKGIVACNGTFGSGDVTGGVTHLVTPDETRLTVSADPGATGVTVQLTFFGIRTATTDFSA